MVGDSDDDTRWLYDRLAKIWVPQSGIPMFKKAGTEFLKDDEGRYIAAGHRNHGNCRADELLEAYYDYTRAFGTFRVVIEDR